MRVKASHSDDDRNIPDPMLLRKVVRREQDGLRIPKAPCAKEREAHIPSGRILKDLPSFRPVRYKRHQT
jgi:hypothetical protein